MRMRASRPSTRRRPKRLGVRTDRVPAKTNPLGIKGAGEAGATGAPPAVIGAILDALRPLGITHIDMPATPNKIWQAIHKAHSAKAAAE